MRRYASQGEANAATDPGRDEEQDHGARAAPPRGGARARRALFGLLLFERKRLWLRLLTTTVRYHCWRALPSNARNVGRIMLPSNVCSHLLSSSSSFSFPQALTEVPKAKVKTGALRRGKVKR